MNFFDKFVSFLTQSLTLPALGKEFYKKGAERL